MTSCAKTPDAEQFKTKAEELATQEKKNQEQRKQALQKEWTEIEKRIQKNKEIQNLIARENAVAGWAKELATPRQVFTSTIQDVLIRADGRPLLLFAQVDDIRKEGDKLHRVCDVFMGSRNPIQP